MGTEYKFTLMVGKQGKVKEETPRLYVPSSKTAERARVHLAIIFT